MNDYVYCLDAQKASAPSIREEGIVRPDARESLRHPEDDVRRQDHLGRRQLPGGYCTARLQEQDVWLMWYVDVESITQS